MRRLILAGAPALFLFTFPPNAPGETASTTKIDFTQNGISGRLEDFEFWRTGHGAAGDWAVVRDVTASGGAAIEQSSRDPTENRYPLAVYKPASLKNFELSASIKMIAGAAQTAGLAVRLTSPGDYYAVAINALEDRVDLYRFKKGRRKRIAGVEADIARDHWQSLRLAVEGDHITVSLDEQLLFKAWDRAFLNDGHIALWTEEDTVARFDRLEHRLPLDGARLMPYQMKSLSCDPARIKGMSERLIISHYENNYGGAVKRLNVIEEQLAGLDYATAPGFVINGLKREQLIATNSMILHELFFDGLGDQSGPGTGLTEALSRDFGSAERWRAEFVSMGKALGGGSGWVLLSWSPRDRKLVNQWASDHCHTLAGGTPILALDMYEHSYHMDFGAKAATYVDTFMEAIRWTNVDRLFSQVSKARGVAREPGHRP